MRIRFTSRMFQDHLRVDFFFEDVDHGDMLALEMEPEGPKYIQLKTLLDRMQEAGEIEPSEWNELEEGVHFPSERIYLSGGRFRMRDEDTAEAFEEALKAMFPNAQIEETLK